jgi:Flp pilus assembly protein TadG
MFTRVTHLRRDERGMSFVFIGMGFMSFLAASTLAIDVGMLMTARTQAQTAADAGALAGAVALAYNSATNFSSSGPAVQGALSAARSDLVMGQQVSIQSGDVTFLPDPATGNTTRVQVTVYRSSVRGNPVPTMIGRIFGISSADISATAVAEAIPANASNCVKPFAIPDKWTEKQTAPWDTSDSFNAAILPPTFSPDVYKTVLDATYTGYKRSNVGLQINMLPATGQIQASQYYALDFSGSYQGNIENCAAAKVTIGDKIAALPLNNSQTYSGVQALINRDPGAYWDTANNKVVSGIRPGDLRGRIGRGDDAGDSHHQLRRLLHPECLADRRHQRAHRPGERRRPGHCARGDTGVPTRGPSRRLIPTIDGCAAHAANRLSRRARALTRVRAFLFAGHRRSVAGLRPHPLPSRLGKPATVDSLLTSVRASS